MELCSLFSCEPIIEALRLHEAAIIELVFEDLFLDYGLTEAELVDTADEVLSLNEEAIGFVAVAFYCFLSNCFVFDDLF